LTILNIEKPDFKQFKLVAKPIHFATKFIPYSVNRKTKISYYNS